MVLAIIVTYNGEKYIEDCIENLQSQTQQIDILVVDNDSTDDTCEIITRKYPRVKVLETGYNSGFACGNNIGIQYAMERGYEYVLLINEDTFSDQMLVEKLLAYANCETAVIPKIYMNGSRTKVWYAAGKLDLKKRRALNCQKELVNSVTEVSFMTGCCMFIHTDIFRKVGLFDEKYFMYYEDTDLSMRMYRQGIKMLYIPDTYVWHRIQGKTRKEYYAYYMTRNRLYFLKKYRDVFHCGICRLVCDEIYDIFCRPDIYGRTFWKCRIHGVMDFIGKRMGRMERTLQRSNNFVGKGYWQLERYRIFCELMQEWMNGCIAGKDISNWIVRNQYKTVGIYGMGSLGEMTYQNLKNREDVQIRYGLDQNKEIKIEGLQVYSLAEPVGEVDLIIVTAVLAYEEIRKTLQKTLRFPCKIISLMQLVEEMYIE